MPDQISRETLPIPHRPFDGTLPFDARDPEARFRPIEPLRPPAGAPNVLVILLDDVGFGASSAFGGPCQTPTVERLAAGGLKYNRFHTTALCAPTRAALLTGRNHHTVGMGVSPSWRPRPRLQLDPAEHCAPLHRRCGLTATRRRSSASAMRSRSGRRARWGPSTPGRPVAAGSSTSTALSAARPTSTTRDLRGHHGGGAGEDPRAGLPLYRGHDRQGDQLGSPAEAADPDKPFLVYYAPGATHAPHHVPTEWSERYRGRSTGAGTRSGRRSWLGRRYSALCLLTPS